MSKIIGYQRNDNGTITAVINDVQLTQDELQLIDNGIALPIEVRSIDTNKITDKQRKKIFALCNDIEIDIGQPRDYMRYMFQEYIRVLYGYEKEISLSNCTRKQASQIIEAIIDWMFFNNITFTVKTSSLLKGDKAMLYWATVNRQCVICGKRAELAHYQAVGRGRNRRKIEHTSNKVLALCPIHHREQHTMGIHSFNKKYSLTDSWVDVDQRLNRLLKGQKLNQS